MQKIPKVGDLMTVSPVSVAASAPIREAKLLMLKHGFRHLPVVDQGRVLGIVSDRDIKLMQAVSRDENFDEGKAISEICTYTPYCVHPTVKVDAVIEHMLKARIGSALIVSGEKLVGIFTVTDACRAFLKMLRDKPAGSTIVADMHSELE